MANMEIDQPDSESMELANLLAETDPGFEHLIPSHIIPIQNLPTFRLSPDPNLTPSPSTSSQHHQLKPKPNLSNTQHHLLHHHILNTIHLHRTIHLHHTIHLPPQSMNWLNLTNRNHITLANSPSSTNTLPTTPPQQDSPSPCSPGSNCPKSTKRLGTLVSGTACPPS